MALPYKPNYTTGYYEIPETVDVLLQQVGLPQETQEVSQSLLPRVETQEVPQSLLSRVGTGLLGTGSAVREAAGLLGQSLQEPLVSGVRDIPETMRLYETLRAQSPMMSFDPADLSSVTPVTAAAALPEVRRKRALEAQEDLRKRREEARKIIDLDLKQQNLLEKRQEKLSKENAAQAQREMQGYLVSKSVDKALELASNPLAVGFVGARLSGVEGTDAFRLEKELDVVRSNLGFEELSKMRQNSPTGGALGQVTVRELELLQSTKAPLELGLGGDELKEALSRARLAYLAGVYGVVDSQGNLQSIQTQQQFDDLMSGVLKPATSDNVSGFEGNESTPARKRIKVSAEELEG